MFKIRLLFQRVLQYWRAVREKAVLEESERSRRERITVFAISWVLATGLWFLVNLGKSFTVTIDFPLQWGEIEPRMAPVDELPRTVEATIYGEGWVLLSLKNRTPTVRVDASAGDVNVYEMVRVIMAGYPQAAVNKVFPSIIQVKLDEKAVKKVPVRLVSDIQFTSAHGFAGEQQLVPDSITVSGAKSLLESTTFWETAPLRLRNVKEPLKEAIRLRAAPNHLGLSHSVVEYTAGVSAFTEGEIKVPVTVMGGGLKQTVTFSPAMVSIRFNVPVGDYERALIEQPYTAVVEWKEIARDSSGFASPTIVNSGRNKDIQLRSYQPRRVAYYFNVSDSNIP